jgi:hypothetical protein
MLRMILNALEKGGKFTLPRFRLQKRRTCAKNRHRPFLQPIGLFGTMILRYWMRYDRFGFRKIC